MRLDLPADLQRDVEALLANWESGAMVARLAGGLARLRTAVEDLT